MHRDRPSEPTGTFRFRLPIETRFRDTDAMGHVNNAVYLTYFEMARAAYYREVTGATFGIGAETGEGARSFILAEARVTFASPAFFGEPLEVETRVDWVGRSSFGMAYRLTAGASPRGPAHLVAFGETAQVMYEYGRARVRRLPAELVALFEAYEGRPIPRR